MKHQAGQFDERAQAAVADRAGLERRKVLYRGIPHTRQAAIEAFPAFDSLREHFAQIKRHTLDHLSHYLEQFEHNALDNGAQVHFARTGEEMNSIVLDICQRHGSRRVVKGKSMVTEETGLAAWLDSAGLDVVETDLGEYIVQQAGETPSHIVLPALHKSQAQIRTLFRERHLLGERELENPEDLVAEARQVLREHFLKADVGIIGANALVAETGYSMLVTNEGNGDLCANLPPVLIVCASVEKLLPRSRDAMALQRLLVRSATGQDITSYTSFYGGPRRSDELDGPLETHVIVLDNQRSQLLEGDYAEMLACVRCGSCLSHCPVYAQAGGHAYGSVYPGPMGSVLTPLLSSLEEAHVLPNACTGCGRCAEVCPSAIPLPDLLRDLRRDEHEQKLSSPRWRIGLALHGWLLRHPGLYQTLTSVAARLLYRLGAKRGAHRTLPLTGGWTDSRDFPAPQGDTFLRQIRKRKRR